MMRGRSSIPGFEGLSGNVKRLLHRVSGEQTEVEGPGEGHSRRVKELCIDLDADDMRHPRLGEGLRKELTEAEVKEKCSTCPVLREWQADTNTMSRDNPLHIEITQPARWEQGTLPSAN